MKKEEFFYVGYSGKKVKFIKTFKDNGKEYAIVSADDWFEVVGIENLIPYEKSYQYQQQLKRQAEEEKLKANEDLIAKRIQKKAIDTLVMRMKLNSIFSEDNKMTQIGLAVAEQLKKLIEEKDVYDLKKIAEEPEVKK